MKKVIACDQEPILYYEPEVALPLQSLLGCDITSRTDIPQHLKELLHSIEHTPSNLTGADLNNVHAKLIKWLNKHKAAIATSLLDLSREVKGTIIIRFSSSEKILIIQRTKRQTKTEPNTSAFYSTLRESTDIERLTTLRDGSLNRHQALMYQGIIDLAHTTFEIRHIENQQVLYPVPIEEYELTMRELTTKKASQEDFIDHQHELFTQTKKTHTEEILAPTFTAIPFDELTFVFNFYGVIARMQELQTETSPSEPSIRKFLTRHKKNYVELVSWLDSKLTNSHIPTIKGFSRETIQMEAKVFKILHTAGFNKKVMIGIMAIRTKAGETHYIISTSGSKKNATEIYEILRPYLDKKTTHFAPKNLNTNFMQDIPKQKDTSVSAHNGHICALYPLLYMHHTLSKNWGEDLEILGLHESWYAGNTEDYTEAPYSKAVLSQKLAAPFLDAAIDAARIQDIKTAAVIAQRAGTPMKLVPTPKIKQKKDIPRPFGQIANSCSSCLFNYEGMLTELEEPTPTPFSTPKEHRTRPVLDPVTPSTFRTPKTSRRSPATPPIIHTATRSPYHDVPGPKGLDKRTKILRQRYLTQTEPLKDEIRVIRSKTEPLKHQIREISIQLGNLTKRIKALKKAKKTITAELEEEFSEISKIRKTLQNQLNELNLIITDLKQRIVLMIHEAERLYFRKNPHAARVLIFDPEDTENPDLPLQRTLLDDFAALEPPPSL